MASCRLLRATVLLALPWAGCDFRVGGLPLTNDNVDLASAPSPGGDLAMALPDLDAPDLASTTPADLSLPPPPPDLAVALDLSSCNPPPLQPTVGPGPNLAITLSNVAVNGGGRVAHVAAGATFTVSADYAITDSGGNHVDQIIVGVAPSDPQACLFDSNVHNQTRTGNGTATLTAPTTPGTYTIRFHYGQAKSCDPSGWWAINGAPTSAQDFAAICVQ